MNELNRLTNSAKKYYKSKIFDAEEFQDDFQKAYLARKFFIKLHSNKDVNITLLTNHITCLYNSFDSEYITKYLYYYIDEELKMYLKTILLYLNKIKIDNLLYSNVSISYDFDYLLKSKK